MNGYVKNVRFGYAFVAGEDGIAYFAHALQMPCDEVGRRYLLPSEQVTFTPASENGKPQAHSVQLVVPRPPVVVSEYKEEGTVRNVEPNGGWCFLLRPYGGVAQLHWRNVKGCTQLDVMNRPVFYEGQRWQFGIGRPREITNPPRPWLAICAVEIPSQ